MSKIRQRLCDGVGVGQLSRSHMSRRITANRLPKILDAETCQRDKTEKIVISADRPGCEETGLHPHPTPRETHGRLQPHSLPLVVSLRGATPERTRSWSRPQRHPVTPNAKPPPRRRTTAASWLPSTNAGGDCIPWGPSMRRWAFRRKLQPGTESKSRKMPPKSSRIAAMPFMGGKADTRRYIGGIIGGILSISSFK